jgi:hypothetical protein
MALIGELHRLRCARAGDATSLDDRTCDDLHLDAVFASLDRTVSALGQQALYHRLRSSPVAEHLDAFEALVDRIGADAATRERLHASLTPLQDSASYHLCTVGELDIRIRGWHAVFPLLAAVMLLAILSAPFWPPGLLIVICGVVVHFVVRIVVAGETGALLGLFHQVEPLLRAADAISTVRTAHADPILGVLDRTLPCVRRLRVYARWTIRDAGGNELIEAFYQYLNIVFLLDVNAFYFGARELRRQADALLAIVGAVGEVDAAMAVASYRAGTAGWTRPRRDATGTPVRVHGVRHPLIEGAVANDVVLGPPWGLLLTGANMSGKSTLLRTIGINVVLAQTINTCLATSYDAPVLHVRSLMGRADDLIAGKSYYLVEAEAVVEMLAAASGEAPHLFLFDELFRGTNTIERIAAGTAVLRHLAGAAARPCHITVAATHDRELVDLLDGHYMPAHLADSIGSAGMVFDYRLQPGPATSRNALTLLKLTGAPEAVVGEAQSLATALDRTWRGVGDNGLSRS